MHENSSSEKGVNTLDLKMEPVMFYSDVVWASGVKLAADRLFV